MYEGDLFAQAPKCCVLVHACNTKGVWGSGIAAAFKVEYPEAYEIYQNTCLEKGDSLLGTCLIIPTGERDIACLFTSRGFGKAVDPKDSILASTKTATEDLLVQLKDSDKPIYGWYVYDFFSSTYSETVNSSRINAGRFGVPWEETVAVLEEVDLKMTVYEILPIKE